MTARLAGPTLRSMNDVTLLMAAVFGLALTAGAILFDTRHRLAVLAVGTAHGRTMALAITPWTADPSPVETRAA